MKVLNFSWDRRTLEIDSATAQKIKEYGQLVEKYTVIAPANENAGFTVNDNTFVYGLKSVNTPIGRIAYLFKLYNYAENLIAKDKYDVLTVQDPFELALIGWLLAKKFNIGLNIQEHGDFFSADYWRSEKLANKIRFYLGQFLIGKAASIRTVSQRIKNTLVAKYGINRDKIIIVPMHTEIKQRIGQFTYANLREKYRGKFIFLTMARLVKQKNLFLLISAFKKVAEHHLDTVLFIVGSGPEFYHLKTLAFNLGISHRVEFFDWTEDVYGWYESADAYVLSSNYEGWGRVIIEAAYANLPIIMTDVGCAGEFIENGASGLVVPVNNTDALAEAMVKVIEDEALRKKISAGAKLALLELPNKEETLALYKKSWEVALTNRQ